MNTCCLSKYIFRAAGHWFSPHIKYFYFLAKPLRKVAYTYFKVTDSKNQVRCSSQNTLSGFVGHVSKDHELLCLHLWHPVLHKRLTSFICIERHKSQGKWTNTSGNKRPKVLPEQCWAATHSKLLNFSTSVLLALLLMSLLSINRTAAAMPATISATRLLLIAVLWLKKL